MLSCNIGNYLIKRQSEKYIIMIITNNINLCVKQSNLQIILYNKSNGLNFPLPTQPTINKVQMVGV